MRFFFLAIGLVYWVGLTVLLLAPDPAFLLGLKHRPSLPLGDKGIHFTLFLMLTVLVLSARGFRPIGWVLGVLGLYALAAECLQYFVPPRTVEWADLVENLLGIVVGGSFYFVLLRYGYKPRKPAEEATETAGQVDAADEMIEIENRIIP
jgi:VanZ family protein